jgi:hypothetical protein
LCGDILKRRDFKKRVKQHVGRTKNLIAFLALATTFGCRAQAESKAALPVSDEDQQDVVEAVVKKAPPTKETVTAKEPEENVEPLNPWQSYPFACETFNVYRNDKNSSLWYKRNRFVRSKKDRQQTRKLIRMVAREMGASRDAQLVVEMMAMHESTWNPEAIHILNADRLANIEAWEKYTYSAARAAEIKQKLAKVSARDKEFWKLRSKLESMSRYAGNPFWQTLLEYGDYYGDDVLVEQQSVWSFGYGLFGMNAVLFTHLWDTQAPPWILCGDEGIVAVVTAIWSLRRAQNECNAMSKRNPEKYGEDGGTAYGVVRRFAKGRCSDKVLGPVWRKLMANKSYGKVAWDKSLNLGNKWSRFEQEKRKGRWVLKYETAKDAGTGEPLLDAEGNPVHVKDELGRKIPIPTDRVKLLEHMRKVAQSEGLLRSEPLKRTDPKKLPKLVD